jgi:hypothetical protein
MSNAINVTCTVAKAYAIQVPLPARANTRGMVSTGEVVGAMAATDWASVSQGVRMLWRKPYCVWLAGKSDASTAVVSGGSGASPENWFKVTEFASDDESGKGLKSDVLSLRGSPRGSQRILSTV